MWLWEVFLSNARRNDLLKSTSPLSVMNTKLNSAPLAVECSEYTVVTTIAHSSVCDAIIFKTSCVPKADVLKLASQALVGHVTHLL